MRAEKHREVEEFTAQDVAKVNIAELKKIRNSMTPDKAHEIVTRAIDQQLDRLSNAKQPRFDLAMPLDMCW